MGHQVVWIDFIWVCRWTSLGSGRAPAGSQIPWYDGGLQMDRPDDLDLRLDDQRVGHSEALQHLVQLHELLPAPVMLLLAKSMEGVCTAMFSRLRR